MLFQRIPTYQDQNWGLNASGPMGNLGSGFNQIPGGTGTDSGMIPQAQGLGMNMPTAQLGLAGISTLGNLWGAFQANKLAKNQFDFTKGVTETNLANSMKAYNTQLADRARSRAAVEGSGQSAADEYIRQNQLTR